MPNIDALWARPLHESVSCVRARRGSLLWWSRDEKLMCRRNRAPYRSWKARRVTQWRQA